jgi:hypothetical protein
MKRSTMITVGLIVLFCASAFAIDRSAADSPPLRTAQTKNIPPRITRMSATGKVTEISDTMLKIDRTVKGNVEQMEFALEKPVVKINVGDNVKVSYVTKDGKNVAVRVAPEKKYTIRTKKGTVKKETKPAPGKTPTAPETAPFKK